MAAQALTKGRFVQIIITLSILIGAFTWRTLTHSQAQFVDCKQQTTCSFIVKNTNVDVLFTQEYIQLNANGLNVDVSTHLDVIDSNDNQFTWKRPKSLGQQPISLEVSLENNDIYQVTISNLPQ